MLNPYSIRVRACKHCKEQPVSSDTTKFFNSYIKHYKSLFNRLFLVLTFDILHLASILAEFIVN